MAKPRPQTWKDWLKLGSCGFFMGAADLVPGISGGTVAFIAGIYEDLLHSIGTFNGQSLKDLLRGRFRAFREDIAWEYLLAVAGGLLFALLSLSRVIRGLMNEPDSRCLLYAAFSGFILASAWICLRMLGRPKWPHLVALLAGVAFAYLGTHVGAPKGYAKGPYSVSLGLANPPVDLVNYDSETGRLLNLDADTLAAMLARGILPPEATVRNDATGESLLLRNFQGKVRYLFQPWVMLCGAIAVSAMLLPGVSGSYLLNALGMYLPVIAALADLSSGDFEALFLLGNLAVGIIAGGLVFARVISWLLDHYHKTTLSSLIGLMIGALPTIWPFWETVRVLRPLKLHQAPLLVPVQAVWPANSFLVWETVALSFVSFIVVAYTETKLSKK